ncbi:hypothetical protein [Granulicella sibirica]|uniref:Peptidase n=1 Tax=Granulicella sibirica TaxID=2479048 RepID=A0A4Q0T276_9BACT|nr:hypothetical protein [Granulicella sibirica]RXH56088.1 hypothetical protein GRAN_2945 [Granulicella sibirica]
MSLRSIVSLTGTLAISASLFAAPNPADLKGLNGTFTLDHSTQIPSETLKPGDYTIHIVDSFGDRLIVQIDSPTNKEHAIFLGVLGFPASRSSAPGIIDWSSGANHQQTLRGFSFGSGKVVEFVYPKPDAVQLAKLNDAQVVAVDYESEHLKSLNGLNPDELRAVNLWMLSLTTTGTDRKTPAILAERYRLINSDQPVIARFPSSPSAQPAYVPPPAAAPPAAPEPQVARLEQPRPIRPAFEEQAPSRAHRTPVISTLPHTASSLPLIALLGFFSLMAALVMRVVRTMTRDAV